MRHGEGEGDREGGFVEGLPVGWLGAREGAAEMVNGTGAMVWAGVVKIWVRFACATVKGTGRRAHRRRSAGRRDGRGGLVRCGDDGGCWVVSTAGVWRAWAERRQECSGLTGAAECRGHGSKPAGAASAG